MILKSYKPTKLKYMAQVHVYNRKGEQIKQAELSANVFEVSVSPALVHQAVVAQNANSRQVLAHTKDRSEVRGGGRKPWRQKGTGRARHGSIRSPLWVGGGVTFGPRNNRNFSLKLNKKMKKRALCMTLSDKVSHDSFLVIDTFGLDSQKTKEMKDILSALKVGRKTLIVIDKQDKAIWKSAANLSNVRVVTADSLNVVDIVNASTLVVMETALPIIESTYSIKKEEVKEIANS